MEHCHAQAAGRLSADSPGVTSGALDPDAILADLNEEQRQAATAVSGPVMILAGAGTGKTRVISHRVAYAVAIGAVDERQVLVVSFTNKAADEMSGRLRRLGLRRASASTLHAAARRQLEHFWPVTHGTPLPTLITSKLPVISPLARRLPGGYRYTPARDLADEIEWAKNRRVAPAEYPDVAAATDRTPPIPIDLMGRLYADYERAKQRAGVLDFEDLLEEAARLYGQDAEAAQLVRRRYAWFSVDEYQDTNPLQQSLLDAWLGDRRDLAVVGDPNQTIYSFTGATPRYLLEFAKRFPEAKVVSLVQNYRSTPQILDLANRLVAGSAGPTLRATKPEGPAPGIEGFADGATELASLVGQVQRLLANGSRPGEIAVLTRTNVQLEPLAAALRAAAVPFHFQGTPFYRTPEVRAAIRALRGAAQEDGEDLVSFALRRWRPLGFDPEAPGTDDPEAALRRQLFETLLGVARAVVVARPGAAVDDLLAEFERQAAVETDEAADGVTLSTIHGAKGAEWSAVFIPMLEDGALPIHFAFRSPEAMEEERRLLYVAVTRAQATLVLSWARLRDSPKGTAERRTVSRFVEPLLPPRPSKVARSPARGAVTRDRSRKPGAGDAVDPDQVLVERLMEWRRTRARRDGVPAYVVAHDAHLRAIAAARPSTQAELLGMPGMGPVKAERYGDEILSIVRDAASAPGP